MKDLHLKRFEANSFMGISTSDPIIIDFTKSRKGQNIVKLKGDQGVGKTSTMTALMFLMGAAFDIDPKNFKNLEDKDIDLNLEFEHEGIRYKVEAGSTRVTLKSYIKERDKWVSESSPKETLRKIFGPLGVSPLFLGDLPGKKQIQWFKDTFGNDEETTKKEQKIVAQIDELFSNRREVNRVIKSLKGWLDESALYQDYEKNVNRFKKPISVEKEKKAFDELANKKSEYDRYKAGHSNLSYQHSQKLKEVEELEKKLAEAKQQESELRIRVDNGDKWLKENASVVTDFEKANNEWLNISKLLADQEQWKEVLKKEKEYTEMVDASTDADAKLDKLRLDLLKLTKKYIPAVDGLEVKIKTSLTDEEEGIYYNGKTLTMLSESERWALFADHIWPHHGVQFVFCENVSSLGSDAIGVLNNLAKDGAMIFASEMDRKKDHIEISIETKLT